MPTAVFKGDVRELVEHGAQLVEVLPPKEYEEEHLPGAMNISFKLLDQETTAQLKRAEPVVVYCHDYLRRAETCRDGVLA
jgi:rhodanese-related sulfurtransferase